MANAKEYKNTWYAVAHFGTSGKDEEPCLLKEVPYTNSKGQLETAYHHFTYNIDAAAMFATPEEADKAKRNIQLRLEKENPPLADKVKVVRVSITIQDKED